MRAKFFFSQRGRKAAATANVRLFRRDPLATPARTRLPQRRQEPRAIPPRRGCAIAPPGNAHPRIISRFAFTPTLFIRVTGRSRRKSSRRRLEPVFFSRALYFFFFSYLFLSVLFGLFTKKVGWMFSGSEGKRAYGKSCGFLNAASTRILIVNYGFRNEADG